MDKFHQKIVKALSENLANVVDWLDDVPELGQVTGAVVSSSFEGLDHHQRQELLWTQLNRILTPDEAERVGPIVAMTPAEATVKAE